MLLKAPHSGYQSPKGTASIQGAEKMCLFVFGTNQNGSSGDTATILQYTYVTGPNQSGSSWDRPPATPLLGFHPARFSIGLPRLL